MSPFKTSLFRASSNPLLFQILSILTPMWQWADSQHQPAGWPLPKFYHPVKPKPIPSRSALWASPRQAGSLPSLARASCAVRADFREGNEDSNSSISDSGGWLNDLESLHWTAFSVEEVLAKPLIHWMPPPFHSKTCFFTERFFVASPSQKSAPMLLFLVAHSHCAWQSPNTAVGGQRPWGGAKRQRGVFPTSVARWFQQAPLSPNPWLARIQGIWIGESGGLTFADTKKDGLRHKMGQKVKKWCKKQIPSFAIFLPFLGRGPFLFFGQCFPFSPFSPFSILHILQQPPDSQDCMAAWVAKLSTWPMHRHSHGNSESKTIRSWCMPCHWNALRPPFLQGFL